MFSLSDKTGLNRTNEAIASSEYSKISRLFRDDEWDMGLELQYLCRYFHVHAAKTSGLRLHR